jgi:hypothetical protein
MALGVGSWNASTTLRLLHAVGLGRDEKIKSKTRHINFMHLSLHIIQHMYLPL